jgi:hypothetical protein
MQEAIVPAFAAWESYYVIVGSSAAALTGLQFVVMALAADAHASSTDTVDAFATPTIVHFCAVLLIAAILSAPWHTETSAAVLLAIAGALGVGYTLIVMRRARRTTDYKPVLEDWIWHVILPVAAYAVLLVAGTQLTRHAHGALFVVAAAVLTLLYVGIHNSWDSVIDIAVARRAERKPPAER